MVAVTARFLLLGLLAVTLLLPPTRGGAQPATRPADAAASDDAPPTRGRRGPALDKVIALEGDTIVGRVPKPQVFYVLGRQEKRYRGLGVKRSFVRRIVDSLKRNPL